MMRGVKAGTCLVLGVIVLSGCGRAAIPLKPTNGGCISMADTVKTIRVGDELPRVVQVLGMPNRGYRVFSPFGKMYDVIEYDITPSTCYKVMLDADDKVQVYFDKQGKYVGTGGETARKMRRVTTVRVEPFVLDPVVLRP
jgi:outer membrane protein assembly factor BamE (lipoprotein component of BamABCDE complex)